MMSYSRYISLFTKEVVNKNVGPSMFNLIVTGEASADTVWGNDRWPLHPGNEGKDEPIYIVAHSIWNVTPQAKFIFMVREPVERLFSHYLMTARQFHHYEESADSFHKLVMEVLPRIKTCLREKKLRTCAYDPCLKRDAHAQLAMPITLGMFSVFIRDWLEIFPKESIKVIFFEEYVMHRSNTVKELAEFLDTETISDQVAKKIDDLSAQNKRKEEFPMRNDTRKLLQEFYIPFNEDLSQVLSKEQPVWRYTL